MRLPKHRLFDYTTPGKGVDENEPPKTGIKLFGDILYRRLWKMVSVNLLYVLFSIPALIIIWFLTYGLLMLLPMLSGIAASNDSQTAVGITWLCTFVTCIVYALFGGGAPTAAMTYVLRNYREDRHAWVWSDFKEKFKENFKQGTIVFIIDYLVITLLVVNYWFYGIYSGSNIAAFLLQGLMAVIFFLFLLMHSYIYPIMISFDLRLRDIYKYSFILAAGKLPTTLFATVLCLLFCLLISFFAFFFFIYIFLLIPFIMFAFSCYMNLFITYPIVKKYIANDGGEKQS